MKRTYLIALIVFVLSMFMYTAYAADLTVATGKPTLSYHTKQFKLFKGAVKRISGEDHEVEYAFPKKGTDGSKQNIKLVNRGEKANVGFAQYGATVIENADNTTAFGPFAYELANLVYKKGSKFSSCGDLESKKARVGLNTQSGSAVTWDVYGKVDKDYTKASVVDTPRGSIAQVKLTKGDIDAYFWISAPGTADHKRFRDNPSIKFGYCSDGDFDDYKINGTVLYPKVTLGKKLSERLGFGKIKIKTHLVPAYIIVNNSLLEEDESLYDLFTDVATHMYQANRNNGSNKEWYPKQ
jgi:hypothetical protein